MSTPVGWSQKTFTPDGALQRLRLTNLNQWRTGLARHLAGRALLHSVRRALHAVARIRAIHVHGGDALLVSVPGCAGHHRVVGIVGHDACGERTLRHRAGRQHDLRLSLWHDHRLGDLHHHWLPTLNDHGLRGLHGRCTYCACTTGEAGVAGASTRLANSAWMLSGVWAATRCAGLRESSASSSGVSCPGSPN